MAPSANARGHAGAIDDVAPSSTLELAREYGPRAAGFALPFLLVVYLGLRGGGYDAVVRGEVGIAIWWIVLLGALVGVLPVARITRVGWTAIGLLAAFAAWTALSLIWSESPERSLVEIARVATYLGVLVLAVSVQRADGLRRTVNGLATGIALLGLVALLSRLHPSWFPDSDLASLQPSSANRLSYPLGYWNGLAALMAMGIPLLTSRAVHARTVAARALSAAAIPALVLTAYFTLSRGGAIEIAIGLVALLAFTPRRLAILPTLLVSGAGSAILVAAATQRQALEDALRDSTATAQGDEMLAMALVVCTGVALVQVAISLADDHKLVRVRLTRGTRRTGLAAAAAAAVVAALALGAPGAISSGWSDFKESGGGGNDASRFTSASGNGRYQYWQSSGDANASESVTGTGAGSFEYWWAREGTLPGFVRDSHSLYFETFGELGWIGLLLIAGAIGTVLVAGARGALARRTHSTTSARSAALAAACVFAVACGIDWAWELSILPVAFIICAAVLLAPGRNPEEDGEAAPERPSGLAARGAMAALALACLVAVFIPTLSQRTLDESRAQARAGELDAALDSARSAESTGLSAAAPLQQALVLELQGELGPARDAAAVAADREDTNWRNWLVLSRLEARLGNAQASVDAFRRARDLNPRSALFTSLSAAPTTTEETE